MRSCITYQTGRLVQGKVLDQRHVLSRMAKSTLFWVSSTASKLQQLYLNALQRLWFKGSGFKEIALFFHWQEKMDRFIWVKCFSKIFSQELSSPFVFVSNFPENNFSDTRAVFLIISGLVMMQLCEQQGKLSEKAIFYQKQHRKLDRATGSLFLTSVTCHRSLSSR